MNQPTFFRKVLVLVACSVVLLAAETACAAVVRGRLDRMYPNGLRYPAPGVGVTIYNPQFGRSAPSFAGPDGIYYLQNVPAGPNYLEIWTSRDPRVPPTVYPIQVAEPYTDIPPILVP